MDTKTILTLLLWLEKEAGYPIELINLFSSAYKHTFKVRNDSMIFAHVSKFEKTGIVPPFVHLYIKREIYPRLRRRHVEDTDPHSRNGRKP